jgi:hypothetical protein
VDPRDVTLAKLAVALSLIDRRGYQRATALAKQFPGRSFDRLLLDTGLIDPRGHQRLLQAFQQQARQARPQRPQRSNLQGRGLEDSDLLPIDGPPARGPKRHNTEVIQVPDEDDLDLAVPDDIYAEPTMVLQEDGEGAPDSVFDEPTLAIPDDDSDDGPLVLKMDDSDDGIFAEPTMVLEDESSQMQPEDIFAEPTMVLDESGGGAEDIFAEPTMVLGEADEGSIYDQHTLALPDDDSNEGPLSLVDDSSDMLPALEERKKESGEIDALDVRLARDVDQRAPRSKMPTPGVRSKKGGGPLNGKEFQRRLKMRLGFEGFTIGDYKILGEIARGAFGVVLEAEPGGVTKSLAKDRGYEGMLALKVALENKADPRAAERFLEETRVQIGFNHPHIVRIFDSGVEAGLTYYSMEMIEGQECRSHVLKNGPMPPLLAVRLIKETASALAYVHKQRIYHRDLKPHNILLDKKAKPFRAVLIDFGLVTEHLKNQDKGLILGTPSYMPPEQAQPRGGHGPINSTSDIYALGATFYFMLTGKAPFTDSNPRKIIKMVVEDQPRDPVEFNPQIPRRIADVCLKCIEKRQRDRYHSAKLLEADLEKELKSGQRMLKAKSFLGRFLGKKK